MTQGSIKCVHVFFLFTVADLIFFISFLGFSNQYFRTLSFKQ